MKVINTATGETLAEIVTNHSMSVDDVVSLMKWHVTEDGDVLDDVGCVGCYDDIELEY